jgi:hypothetical protein
MATEIRIDRSKFNIEVLAVSNDGREFVFHTSDKIYSGDYKEAKKDLIHDLQYMDGVGDFSNPDQHIFRKSSIKIYQTIEREGT